MVATETGADEKSGEVTVVLEEKRIVEKRKTATPHMPTSQEFKLLQRIKQAQDDASESEEEDEVVDEPEEDDDLTEPEAPQQKADDNNKDTPYTPKIPTPSPSSPHSSSPLKRKARTPSPDIQPPAKKSRTRYKSANIIEDSDDGSDSAIPAALALKVSERRKELEFTEALSGKSEESVEDADDDGNEVRPVKKVRFEESIGKEIESERKEKIEDIGNENNNEEDDDDDERFDALFDDGE
jgi:hypothetical protein